MNAYLLDLLSVGTLISRVLVITSANPVISVLFLISAFVNAAGYLLVIGIGFIGISYLIVYVGAIAILFLFVIMMLNIQLTEVVSVGAEYTKNLPLGFMVGSLILFEVLSVIPYTYSLQLPVHVFNWVNASILGLSTRGNHQASVHMVYTPQADQCFTGFGQVEAIGQGLYTYGSIWLFMGRVILLLSMLGPIALCLRKEAP